MSGLRVLAAMSGGVDSATAAARAADAGHDVTGVHLALSSNPSSYRTGARGCCTLEDARDARRAADVHRHPVLRVGSWSSASTADVVEDFVAESYARGDARRTRACAATRSIKFCRRCWTGPGPSGSMPSVTGYYARIAQTASGPAPCRVDARARTSPTCWPCSPGSSSATAMFPLGDTPKAQVRAEAARARARGRRTSPTATTSVSSPTATPGAS